MVKKTTNANAIDKKYTKDNTSTYLFNSLFNNNMLTSLHQSYIHPLNNSKLFAGILMILMNVGARYIEMGFTKSQEHALKSGLGREIVIFCVVFLGTRDLIISILMTSAFIILSDHVFNEKSKYCIIPNKMKHIASLIDTNIDGIITESEEKKAIEVLEKAKKLRKKRQQGEFLSYMNNYNGQDSNSLTSESFTSKNVSSAENVSSNEMINEGFTDFEI
jgi:hypothetical protein